MALLTVAECKAILGLEDNTYNERINIFIPYVQDDIRTYCNNDFADTTIFRGAVSALEFVRGDTNTSSTRADKITDADDEFTTSGFRTGMDIVVIGGSNAGYYRLAAVSTDTLTLTSTGEIEDQAQTTYHEWPGRIQISRVKWPQALKPIAAKMVWYLIEAPLRGDVRSESVDDYSVTYAGSNFYPERLVNGLNMYKKMILV